MWDFRRPDWFRRGLLVGPLVKRDGCSKLLHNSITALHHSMILGWHLQGCYKVMHHIIQVYYTVASIVYSGCSNVCPIAYPFCIMAYKVIRFNKSNIDNRHTNRVGLPVLKSKNVSV